MKKIKDLLIYVMTILNRSKKHETTAYCGQMAYFFVLSVFPMLILIFSIVSKFDLNFNSIYLIFEDVLPENISALIVEFVEQSITVEGTAVLSLSGILTVYSASRAVAALERAINAAHGFETKRNFFISKFYSMLYTVMFIALIVVSIFIPTLGVKAIEWFNAFFHIEIGLGAIGFIQLLRWLLLPIIYVVVIGSIYTFLPHITLPLKHTYKGAGFAIIGSIATNVVFSKIVVKMTDYSILYGSLSAMIALMVWLYALGTILMFGAEINAYEIEKNQPNG